MGTYKFVPQTRRSGNLRGTKTIVTMKFGSLICDLNFLKLILMIQKGKKWQQSWIKYLKKNVRFDVK